MTWAWYLLLVVSLYPLAMLFCIVDTLVWIIKNDIKQLTDKCMTSEEADAYVQHVFQEIVKERSKRS